MAKVTIKVEDDYGNTLKVEREHDSQWVALARGFRFLTTLGQHHQGIVELAAEVEEKANNHHRESRRFQTKAMSDG